MSRRRLRRRSAKAQRHEPPRSATAPLVLVRQAARIERLAYTRAQAAEALGISGSTFNRRVLPFVETIEMPWGARLIPVDELHRLLAERRQPAREPLPPSTPGRPPVVPDELVDRIRAERSAGNSLRQIACNLNATDTPTAHGGARWWASTVRGILERAT